MTRRLVVVGGPHDGERYDAREDCREYFLSLRSRMPVSVPGKMVGETVVMSAHSRYLLEGIRVNSVEIFFLRHDGIAIEDAIRRLVAGYERPFEPMREALKIAVEALDVSRRDPGPWLPDISRDALARIRELVPEMVTK